MRQTRKRQTTYKVTARAYSATTGLPIGMKRTETINTRKNALFENVKNKKDIKRKYEQYWNNGKEKVKVLSID